MHISYLCLKNNSCAKKINSKFDERIYSFLRKNSFQKTELQTEFFGYAGRNLVGKASRELVGEVFEIDLCHSLKRLFALVLRQLGLFYKEVNGVILASDGTRCALELLNSVLQLLIHNLTSMKRASFDALK